MQQNNEHKQKPGPKPKQLKEKTVLGLQVGRDKTIIPPEDVYKLAEIGCKDVEIANWFGINENTLRYNFSAELLKGREELKISLRRTMFKNAIDNNNTVMQIFLAKNYLGMSDSPMNSEANTPLPWNETEETDLNIGEETDEDSESIQE